MCYHSNKLNVHYLHDIGSPSLQITLQEEGKKKSHQHMDHFQATLHRFYHTEGSLHTETPALPGLECGRTPGHRGLGTHAKEREGG